MDRTITFNAIPDTYFSTTPVALSATSSSGLPVQFNTLTPQTCWVSGTDAIMLAPGTCTLTAGQPGNGSSNLFLPVKRSFEILLGDPAPATITAATPGDRMIILTFSPPAHNGGAPILKYEAGCYTPSSGNSTWWASSPMAVRLLTNNVTYTCTVSTYTEAGGFSQSAPVTATPSAVPLALVGVQSRKAHGAPLQYAFPFDLPIDSSQPITGEITVEPRMASSGHTIAFQFNGPITTAGTATAVDSAAQPIGTTSTTASGNEVLVTLASVPNSSRVKVSLSGVNGTTSASASVGFLIGDVSNNGRVDVLDILLMRLHQGQFVDVTNFNYDLTLTGSINVSDLYPVRYRSGQHLP